MKVPLSWLQDYVNISMPVSELIDRLTMIGLEVEEIEHIGVAGGEDKERLVWDRQKLVVGHILQVQKHPDADRLLLAKVDYGGREPETVVTGAPNLFSYVGQEDIATQKLYSPFALEGVTLYDGHKEGKVKMTLKAKPLRGIMNRCMLCSAKELGLSNDHEGILFLEGEQIPGTPIADLLGDVVLDISILPNMARCASIIGVARELAAITGQKVRYPSYRVQMDGQPIAGTITIHTEQPDLNPRFVAMVITGVEQKPSPQWMQYRLQRAGQRSINVVVDVSNYVMLEMGQPNHTFDYDFLQQRANQYAPNGPIQLITRLPHEGETLTTLDGESHALYPFNILVTDPLGNLSLGGVMGGKDSEIGAGTSNVLLEAAAWDFINIRHSMDKLKMKTEASFRFSRGVHPSQAILGARRVAELLRLYAGGTVGQGIIDYYPKPAAPIQLAFSAADVKRLGGLDLAPSEVKEILQWLEFEVEEQADKLWVTVPDYRLDVAGTHDLVEEVCRIYGYDRIPATLMADRLPAQRGNPTLAKEELIKDHLVQLGWQEVVTHRLTTAQQEGKLLVNSQPDDRPYVTLANPISTERVAMRHTVLAAVMELVVANYRVAPYLALFELGQIYLMSEEGVLPDEPKRLAMVMRGVRQTPHWQNGQITTLDFYDLKGAIEQLLTDLHIDKWQVEAASHPSWRPGRTAQLWLGKELLGVIGELHPLVLEAYDLPTDLPVLAAELDVDLLLRKIPDGFLVKSVPAFPPIQEDLALVMDKTVPADKVEATLKRAGGRLLAQVQLFDLYEGGQLPPGKKSLAYHLTFQADDRTLTDKDASKLRQRILQQLEREIGAKLR